MASIDTGVEWDHPALKEKYRGFDPARPNEPSHEFNWYDATTGSKAPYDDLEHGTHVTERWLALSQMERIKLSRTRCKMDRGESFLRRWWIRC